MALVPQLQAADLGARMDHAMRHAFNCGHERVAIVGTDVPDLSHRLVAKALQMLDSYQVRHSMASGALLGGHNGL